jgi:chromosome segregation ATPase
MSGWSYMARGAAAVLFFCSVLGLPSARAESAPPDPRATETLPHDEALRALGGSLGASVKATQSDPSIPDILRALDKNIAAAKHIRETVGGKEKVTDEQIADVARQVSEIAKSFREIAELAPGVFQRRKQQLANITAVGEEIGFRLADASDRLAELHRDNDQIQKTLRAGNLPRTDIEKLRLTQGANDAEIHSLEAATAAWNYFAERHDEVSSKLADQSADLDVFFHALRENARVYDAAARTLNMANSVKLALKDLDSIQNLQAVQNQLVQSWGDLMKIVDEVNNGLILKPGM